MPGTGRAAGAPWVLAAEADAGLPDSIKLRMSFLVTRPLRPVPSSPAISTPCSCAILRTSGLDFVRRSSSAVPVDFYFNLGFFLVALRPLSAGDVDCAPPASPEDCGGEVAGPPAATVFFGSSDDAADDPSAGCSVCFVTRRRIRTSAPVAAAASTCSCRVNSAINAVSLLS